MAVRMLVVGALLLWSAGPAQAAVLHVRAGATTGGGTYGSLAEVQAASSPGDTIVVDPAPRDAPPLDGGIELKPGQRLEGGPHSASALPVITNTKGDAVRLADGTTVTNLVIRGTQRGGVYGLDSVGVTIKGND